MVLAIAFEGVILDSGASESVPVYLQQVLLFAQMQLLRLKEKCEEKKVKGGIKPLKKLCGSSIICFSNLSNIASKVSRP